MMSVFKFHQALAVADFLDRNGLPLSTPLPIWESDLLPDTYSPLRDAYPQGGIEMSIGELLVYTLQLSDNNACDLLFRYIGGSALPPTGIFVHWESRDSPLKRRKRRCTAT